MPTNMELYELVAVTIAVLFTASICAVGLWA